MPDHPLSLRGQEAGRLRWAGVADLHRYRASNTNSQPVSLARPIVVPPIVCLSETPVACYFSGASASFVGRKLRRSALCHQSPTRVGRKVRRSALCSPLCSQTLTVSTARFPALPSVLKMAAATENPIISQSLDDNTLSPLPLPAPKHTGQPVMARERKNCVHGKFQPYCKECKGSGLCVHLRHKNRCAICKRSSLAIGSSATITVFLP